MNRGTTSCLGNIQSISNKSEEKPMRRRAEDKKGLALRNEEARIHGDRHISHTTSCGPNLILWVGGGEENPETGRCRNARQFYYCQWLNTLLSSHTWVISPTDKEPCAD